MMLLIAIAITITFIGICQDSPFGTDRERARGAVCPRCQCPAVSYPSNEAGVRWGECQECWEVFAA